MSATSATKRNAGPQISPLPKFLTALAIGFALFLALLVGAGSLYAFSFSGLIYPGISMAGIDLAGLRVDEAEQILASRLTFPTSGKIVFQDGEAVWVAKPAELGLIFDAAANAQAAYQFGRQGNPLLRTYRRLAAWYSGRNLSPQFTYDERLAQAYLAGLAQQVDRPTIEAALNLNGTQVSATPGQIGRQVDLTATLAPLEGQLLSMADGILTLVVKESPPEILDASQQAETAQKILSAPLVLQLPDAGEGDPGPWTIEPQQLARATRWS
jgi:hypothetical protein